MRSPFSLGVTLIAFSSIGLLFPLGFLCIHFLDLSPPTAPPGEMHAPQSIVLTIISLLVPSIRESYPSLCGTNESSIYQMVTRNVSFIINTIARTISIIPQLIASGMVCYTAIAVGYIGLMYLVENMD